MRSILLVISVYETAKLNFCVAFGTIIDKNNHQPKEKAPYLLRHECNTGRKEDKVKLWHR